MVKQIMCNNLIFAYYDANKTTVVSSDASSYGIVGIIMQLHGKQLKPVAYCSKTLTNKKKITHKLKKCLTATWTSAKFCRHFQRLESFKLIIDHKPLVPLINTRDLYQVPVRCQRLLTLSRQLLSNNIFYTDDEITVHVNAVLQAKTDV